MTTQRGKMVIFVAPSGSGKSTMIKRIRKDFPQFHWSVSHTTRPKREGETEGKHYFFVSHNEFEREQEKDTYIEYASVHGNYYGTSKDFIDKATKEGHPLLLDLDIQGADSFKKIFHDDCKVIFISPPNLNELELRLRKRGTDDVQAIQVRLANAKKEMERKNDFDYLVINDNVEQAYKNLCQIIEEILNT